MRLFSWKTLLPTILLLLAAGWLIASPYMALASFKSAIERGDAEAVVSRIDFPSVRQSIKAQAATYTQDPNNAKIALAMGIIGGTVDALITPENVTSLLGAAKKPAEERPRTTVWGTPMRTTERPTANSTPSMPEHWNMRRTGLTTFELEAAGTHPAAGAAAVFTLNGLQWTLTQVRVPAEVLKNAL